MRRTILHGKVQDGKVVLDESTPLPEGAEIELHIVPPRPTGPFVADSDLMKFAGILDDLPPDASQNVDRILYGDLSE